MWFDENALMPGRSYLLRTETDQVSATVTDLKHRVNVNNFAQEAAKSLEMNEVGICQSRYAGADRLRHLCGESRHRRLHPDRPHHQCDRRRRHDPASRCAAPDNIHWQSLDVGKHERSMAKNQRPAVFWFTGLSGSGKSTIANLLEKKLHASGRHTYILDGDNVRHGLNRDLGFTDADRVENIRRVAEVAKLMADAGLIVIVSFISPFRAERRMARELMGKGEFVEVFVDTPFEECAKRDPKGSMQGLCEGKLKNFTGVDLALRDTGKSGNSPPDARQDARGNGETSWTTGYTSVTLQKSNTRPAAASDDRAMLDVFERLAISAGRQNHGNLPRRLRGGPQGRRVSSYGSRPCERAHHPRRIARRLPGYPLRGGGGSGRRHPPGQTGQGLLPGRSAGWHRRSSSSASGDFTVNIALVRDGVPEVGCRLRAPAAGASSGRPAVPKLIELGANDEVLARHAITVRAGYAPLTIVASRSHRTPETDDFIHKIDAAEIVSVGSSLKFCLLANGEADLYPRFGRTMEWDTAAGDAVLRAAGGLTTTLDGKPLAVWQAQPAARS